MDIISTIQVALYDFIFARKNIPFPLVNIILISIGCVLLMIQQKSLDLFHFLILENLG